MNVCSYTLTQQLLAAVKTTIHQTLVQKKVSQYKAMKISAIKPWPFMKGTVNCPPKSLSPNPIHTPMVQNSCWATAGQPGTTFPRPLYRSGRATPQEVSGNVECHLQTKTFQVRNLFLPLFLHLPAQCRRNGKATRWNKPESPNHLIVESLPLPGTHTVNNYVRKK